MQTCQIQDCERPVLARGWCAAHYSRWKNHGDPLGGGPVRRPRRERRNCTISGCDRESKTNALCPMHYQRQRLTGTTDLVPKACSVDECTKKRFKQGFCRTHWTRSSQLGDPLKVRECSVEGCSREAPSGKRGWCLLHYTRWSKHGDVGEAAPRFFEPPRPPIEGHHWCSTCRTELPISDFFRDRRVASGHARVCRSCVKDVRVAIYYGIDGATYRRLLNDQGHVCRICGKPETATHQSGALRRLAVDHDHKCCPGKKSCGKCVRGLLCARCNSAIGLVNEDLAVIDRMAKYLRSF